MKDQPNKQTAQNEQTIKKVWQAPTIEVISNDNILSGRGSTGPEGIRSISGGTYHS